MVDYRLPTCLQPTNYKLWLAFAIPETYDTGATTVCGRVTITGKCTAETDSIVLHSHSGITLLSAALTVDGNHVPCDTNTFTFDNETQKLAVPCPADTLHTNSEFSLTIAYHLTLANDLSGIYAARDEAGRAFVASQFEACDARKAIPCFDEPCYKATWDVEIVHPRSYEAITNMPVTSTSSFTPDAAPTPELAGVLARNTSAEHEMVVTTFQQSPTMSAYLLAFVVGQLEFCETHTPRYGSSETICTRVYTPPGQLHRGRRTLEHAAKLLEIMQNTLKQPFPLPKLDHVPVPDFSAGAMENFGLITYRSQLVLLDAESPAQVVERSLTVVAHEMSHMWFGDCTTMYWWNELWLNESLATLFEHIAVDRFDPTLDKFADFAAGTQAPALESDALPSTHPINVVVNSPAEINEIFDHISYDKGGSVLLMIMRHMGEEKFLEAMSSYLGEFMYKNANSEDFCRHMEAQEAGITAILQPWLEQSGYPLLTVSNDEDEYTITQKRFYSTNNSSDELWPIPLAIRWVGHSYDEVQHIVITQRTTTLQAPAMGAVPIVNHGRFALCRVKYAGALAEAVARAVDAPMDLAALIDDAGECTRAGLYDSCDQIAQLFARAAESNAQPVWQAVANWTNNLALMAAHPSHTIPNDNSEAAERVDAIRQCSGRAASHALARIEAEMETYRRLNDTPPYPLLQVHAITMGLWAATRTGKATISSVFRTMMIEDGRLREGSDLVEALATVPAHLRDVVVGAAVGAADREDPTTVAPMLAYKFATNLYTAADAHCRPDLGGLAAGLFGRIADPELTKLIATRAASFDGIVRNQDIYRIHEFATRICTPSVAGASITWETVKTCWTKATENLGNANFLLSRMVEQTAGRLGTLESAADIRAFFTAHPCAEAVRAVENAVESIASMNGWFERTTTYKCFDTVEEVTPMVYSILGGNADRFFMPQGRLGASPVRAENSAVEIEEHKLSYSEEKKEEEEKAEDVIDEAVAENEFGEAAEPAPADENTIDGEATAALVPVIEFESAEVAEVTNTAEATEVAEVVDEASEKLCALPEAVPEPETDLHDPLAESVSAQLAPAPEKEAPVQMMVEPVKTMSDEECAAALKLSVSSLLSRAAAKGVSPYEYYQYKTEQRSKRATHK